MMMIEAVGTLNSVVSDGKAVCFVRKFASERMTTLLEVQAFLTNGALVFGRDVPTALVARPFCVQVLAAFRFSAEAASACHRRVRWLCGQTQSIQFTKYKL